MGHLYWWHIKSKTPLSHKWPTCRWHVKRSPTLSGWHWEGQPDIEQPGLALSFYTAIFITGIPMRSFWFLTNCPSSKMLIQLIPNLWSNMGLTRSEHDRERDGDKSSGGQTDRQIDRKFGIFFKIGKWIFVGKFKEWRL